LGVNHWLFGQHDLSCDHRFGFLVCPCLAL
jgi:hypothetical protein